MRSVGRYEILHEIGRGGMGVVYLARQRGLDRLVALKELNSVHANSAELTERFFRESRLVGSLNHPNIVTVHDYLEEDGTPYIAMEHLPRGSLRPWVGSLSLTQLAGVLEGILAGLASAADPAGIVHRDLKPENIMVAADGRVKIADFGIAKATQSAVTMQFKTAVGATVGTPAYMAPEQALSKPVGPWTDLYSLGVMAYEQILGRVPFHDAETPMAILLRHVNEPIPPLAEVKPEIPSALSEWVDRLLVKDPAARTSSAAQAWEELEEIVLEMLGPRWRRDARLSERGSAASSPKPLTPAQFESRSVKTPDRSSTPQPSESPTPPPPSLAPPQAPAQPEAESGFLSYGRAPTGVEQPGPQPQQPQPQQPGPQQPASLKPPSESPPISVHQESLVDQPPDISHGPAAASAERTPPHFRARRLGAVALLTALTATAGFVLASAGESARTTPHSGGVSANASSHGPSRAYATALRDAMSTLNGVRAAAGAQLAHAGTARAQAEAAERLARAHEQAAATVRSTTPGPLERAANAAIATALLRMAGGYSAMAGAAHREDRRGFDGGRKAVATGTASLAAAFVQLRKLGYRLGG
jgi:serine/threonine protein kinase